MAETVVCFCMPEPGHFRLLRTVVERLVAAGMRAIVFTHADFRAGVTAAGARFVDLFGNRPVERADATSRPIPCRYVSHAGTHGEELIEEVRGLAPDLIVYETFSVVGPVVARALDLPCVNVCVGHDLQPERLVSALERDPRVSVSDACHRAVERLRTRFGMQDASPFSYATSLSPFLNLYTEPPQFLAAGRRAPFEPLAFFGSISDHQHRLASERAPRAREDGALRVYASFGTIVWRYFADEAEGVLRALAGASSAMAPVRLTVGLGGARLTPATAAVLGDAGVRVEGSVDQWNALRDADVFVTHHGINSTHEAIYQRVPMLSYPFFWDQPALAGICQEMGLALPLSLSDAARGAVGPGDVKAAWERLLEARSAMRARLSEARSWELDVIGARDEVVERIRALV